MSRTDNLPWAEGSLLDPANVGKKVWFSHNGNQAWEAEIVKVTRTNVHLDGNARTPYSLRVGAGANGDVRYAVGMKSGFTISGFTESYRLDSEVRDEIARKIRDTTRSLHGFTTPHLARILAVIEDA